VLPRSCDDPVDGGLTAMLLAAAVAAGKRPRFVDLSATGVRGESTRAQTDRGDDSSQRPALRWHQTVVHHRFGPPGSRPLERVGAAVSDVMHGALARRGASRSSGRSTAARSSPRT
jgi:hypothetical protein